MSNLQRKLFGTDGVRGKANAHPMTIEMAMRIGRAAAYIARKDGGHRHRIVIGKDTRLSGYMIENALASGICSMGGDVLLVGPLPTPGIAFITTSMRADAGVVISASHNPFQDNGIKIFSRDGFKLPDETEQYIEELIAGDELDHSLPTDSHVGRAFRIDDAAGRYVVFLKYTFPAQLDLEGLNMVVDCANGAAYKVAPAVFEELGAKVHLIGAQPNGENINQGCGSLKPEVAAQKVIETGADMGIALDGDADRVIFIDHQGKVVDGDHIMAICAADLHQRGKLARDTVVATVMSNMGLEKALQGMGLHLERAQVGDRYVVERMRQGGFNFGGEQSGHMVFMDYITTGDGLLTALQVLSIMRRREKSLAELAAVMETYPQILVNVRVSQRVNLFDIPDIRNQCQKVELALEGRGRLLVRYSGTEPKVRVMIEGEDERWIETMARETADVIVKSLG